MNGSVKFFDSRQRYLLFVTTTNEKAVVSEKISTIVDQLRPQKPALKIFDAGVGDGAVLMNVLRSCHKKFPTIPFFVSGKDVSMEDARLTIEKLADRLVEHPNMVFVWMFYTKILISLKTLKNDVVYFENIRFCILFI